MLKRSSGILLPIFSLPGPYGIGCFGQEAVHFASLAAKAGFSYWQVLPFSPTSYGNSPYQGLSAYAGNIYFISPEELYRQGLLTSEELAGARFGGAARQIDYGWLYQTREKLLYKAWQRQSKQAQAKVAAYAERESAWLSDYALFRTIKSQFGERPWWEWPDRALRDHDQASLAAVKKTGADQISFIQFTQYEFDRQWQDLKAKINRAGLRLIGDMPIYVAADSADAWSCREYFETGADGLFSRVAGVPPDYFSEDGQLWGNPLYRWPVLAETNYKWWLDRIKAGLRTFDLLRIDHFRGFETFWAVPAGAKNARVGVWEKGPALEFFDKVLACVPENTIIAEDLGDIGESVREFLQATGLPGMKVMQFSLSPTGDLRDRPHRFLENCIAYTGTHDNNTLAGWLKQLPVGELALVRMYCGIDAGDTAQKACRAVIRCLWQTAAQLTVAPVQDFLDLGPEGRINTPGVLEDNWMFRLEPDQLARLDINWIRRLNLAMERTKSE